MPMRWIAAITLWGLVLTGAASAGTMTVLVDREPSGISVYFAADATALPGIFGAGADALLTDDGVVDIDGLYRGTFDTADDIFAEVDTRIGGVPFAFEALSMMVHDPSILPPFETPYDAAMSIAVCNSPETVRNMALDQLDAFLGFYAWKADPLAVITLAFPATGRAAITVEVIDYAPSGEVARSTQSLTDGGSLTLTAPKPARFASLLPLLLGVAALVLAGGVIALARRAGAR